MKLIELIRQTIEKTKQIKETEDDLRELHKIDSYSPNVTLKARILCALDAQKHEINKEIETELEDRDQYNN